MRRVSLAIATDASGDGTSYTPPVTGKVHSVFLDYGDTDTGADLTVTEEATGKALLTITNAGTADVVWYPRIGVWPVANTGAGTAVAGNATTGGLGSVTNMLSVFGRIKCVVAQGGDTKVGTLYFDIEK
jgi:hypothetical protein